MFLAVFSSSSLTPFDQASLFSHIPFSLYSYSCTLASKPCDGAPLCIHAGVRKNFHPSLSFSFPNLHLTTVDAPYVNDTHNLFGTVTSAPAHNRHVDRHARKCVRMDACVIVLFQCIPQIPKLVLFFLFLFFFLFHFIHSS